MTGFKYEVSCLQATALWVSTMRCFNCVNLRSRAYFLPGGRKIPRLAIDIPFSNLIRTLQALGMWMVHIRSLASRQICEIIVHRRRYNFIKSWPEAASKLVHDGLNAILAIAKWSWQDLCLAPWALQLVWDVEDLCPRTELGERTRCTEV